MTEHKPGRDQPRKLNGRTLQTLQPAAMCKGDRRERPARFPPERR